MIMTKKKLFFDGLKVVVPAMKSIIAMMLVLILGISSNLVSSKSIKHHETCQQIGKPEENVTLMYGMDHPNVKHSIIGHVRTLKDCVSLACKNKNASLAYTSRFDCFSVTCHGDEELCWLLPSFKNPSLIFARIGRTSNDESDKTNGKNTKEKDKPSKKTKTAK